MARKSKEAAARSERREGYPAITNLRDEIDRLFDEFSSGWPFAAMSRSGRPARAGFGGAVGGPLPEVDVVEREGSFEIRAELPGVDEKDIDLRVMDDAIVLKAEKREETSEGEAGGDYFLSECRYGAFQRVIPLPPGVDSSEADATFRRGVLTVRMPKRPEHHDEARRINIRST
jgi:HSP20 family protein